MATRKVWYTLSAVLMLVSFASFFMRGLNFAIDFTGGIIVEANFPEGRSTSRQCAAVVVGRGFHEPQVQTFGTTRDVTIRLQSTGRDRRAVLRPMFAADRSASIDPQAKISALEVVGPQVGDELRNSAIVSLARDAGADRASTSSCASIPGDCRWAPSSP